MNARSARLKSALPHPLILASVALMILTFEPFNFSICAWIALAPWLEFLRRSRTKREALVGSLQLGYFFSIAAFWWVASVITEFGQLPWPIGLLALLLFGFIGQPQFILAALPLRALVRRFGDVTSASAPRNRAPNGPFAVLAAMLLAALFYAGLDWCLPKLFVDTLGHALWNWDRVKQAADIGGPAFLTFLLFLVNYAIWDLVSRLRRRGEPALGGALRASLPAAILALSLAIGASFYGGWRIRQIHARIDRARRVFRVTLVQANIGDIEKLAAENGFRNAAKNVLQKFYDLSDEALLTTPKPEAIFWPETSYPSDFGRPESSDDFSRDQDLQAYVRNRGITLAFGGYDRDRLGHSFNTLFYLTPEGDLQSYHKSVLLPFGEYIPLAESLPQIRRWFPMVGFFGRGPGSVVMTLQGVKTQPIICYEALFPQFIRDAVVQGAEVIANITNDSWFGRHGAPYHHLRLAAFRSIEVRVPMIRSTNTGISALVLPDGSLQNPSPLFEEALVPLQVPIIDPPRTLVRLWGDWFAKAALILSLFALAKLFLPRAPVSERTLGTTDSGA